MKRDRERSQRRKVKEEWKASRVRTEPWKGNILRVYDASSFISQAVKLRPTFSSKLTPWLLGPDVVSQKLDC